MSQRVVISGRDNSPPQSWLHARISYQICAELSR